MRFKMIFFSLFVLFFSVFSVSFSVENEITVNSGELIRETIPDNADYGSADSVAYSIARNKAFENHLFQNGGYVVGYGAKDGFFIIDIYYSDVGKLTDSDFEAIETIIQTYAENEGKGDVPIRFIAKDTGHFFPPKIIYTPLLIFVVFLFSLFMFAFYFSFRRGKNNLKS